MKPDKEAVFNECQNPSNWAYMAVVLEKAAGQLDWTKKKDITDWRYIAVYRMLMGFSIENLLKGILIAEDNEVIESGNLNRTLASHNLCALANKIHGLSFSSAECTTLKELESYVKWAGRYPTPKTPKDCQSAPKSRPVSASKSMPHRWLYLACCPQSP